MSDEFYSKHKDTFLKEGATHVETMNAALLKLEKTPEDMSALHDIFRSAHTLKGISAAMSYEQIAELCHAIEDVLEAIRNKQVPLNRATDLLFESFDSLSLNLKKITNNEDEIDVQKLVHKLRQVLSLNKELIEKKENIERPKDLAVIEKLKTIEVKVDRLDTLLKLAEELLVSRIKLELLRELINNPELTAAVDTLGRHITDMQYNIMQVRLVPVGFIFNRFPRLVRDLSKQQEKQVELKIDGGEIELDRSLIDEIGESLTHLIRNAIDHGIETASARVKEKKDPQAKIELVAKRSKEFVSIEVGDDGSGLDLQQIENAAIKQKLILPGASNEEIKNCIFKGISTTGQVTAISGRGLGLSIVKQKIEAIGGAIRVESKKGKGTRFFIKIPLTLAVIKVLFVTVGGPIYAIPINAIERLLTVTSAEIKGMLNFNAIVYGDEDIPITHLSKLFSLKPPVMDSYPIVVIQQGEQRLGLVVDSLLSTQEVVIKPLARVVKENKYFSGSALIGSGEMVLILDIDHLFLSRREDNEWKTAATV